MVYESSYESGQQPFLPDAKRGYWASPHDFIYAGLSLAFRIDLFAWYMSVSAGVVNLIPGFLLGLVVFIVPFMMIQSFMGQFSSSGIISAFRVSPLFKGIGYVTLTLNICVLTYYSVYAVVPMLYMFASLNPTLPWSCEGFKKWATNLTESEETNLCNLQLDNGTYDNEDSSNYSSHIYYINHHIPSVLYFLKMYGDHYFHRWIDVEYSMAWQLLLCALILWCVVAFVVYKFFDTEKFGTMIRYFVWIIVGLLVFLLIRFSFITGAGKAYYDTFVPKWHDLGLSFIVTPIYCISTFGPGWGLFITLSSYNKFKADIFKSCWIIAVGQFALAFGLSIFSNLTEMYFGEITNGNYYSYFDSIWTLYLSSASAMVHMEWANMWSVLFYFMLFLSVFTMMLIQLNSILRTISDEFVSLREKKLQVAMSLIGFMAAGSLYFTSNQGSSYLIALASDVFITQTAVNLLLILVILWIYGRVRFQRDIEFMTGRSYSTWMVNILRFVTTLAMLFALVMGFYVTYYEHLYTDAVMDMIAIFCIAIPWICIPCYAAYQMRMGMGPIKIRFFRCCRPTDWFPVELEHRKKYEEAVASPEINQTFNELKEQEVV